MENSKNIKPGMLIRLLIIALLITISSLPALLCQSSEEAQISLITRLQSGALKAPPESLYLQSSKDIYEPGEDLWFRAWLLDAQYLVPSRMSSTLYVQLLCAGSREVIMREKYPVSDGYSSGHLSLSYDIIPGSYYLTAYTSFSFFNDTSGFTSLRKIEITDDIVNFNGSSESADTVDAVPDIVSESPEKVIGGTPLFTLFPEGGDLLAGVRSKIAFKAEDRHGLPLSVEGTLFEGGDTLLRFTDLHAGMGSFSLSPLSGREYRIRLDAPYGDSLYHLPVVKESGMTISLAGKDDENLYFTIARVPAGEAEVFHLRIQSRGLVYGVASGIIDDIARITIPLHDLPWGITEFTLFNSSLMPVAERLVFANQGNTLQISAEADRDVYLNRGKVTLKIKVRDQNGNPVKSNLGISVFDRLYEDNPNEQNILTHYSLTTQLRGRIYNPSYYFGPASPVREEALDLLMLTNGWRRYLWNEDNLKGLFQSSTISLIEGIVGEVTAERGLLRRQEVEAGTIYVLVWSENNPRDIAYFPVDSVRRFSLSPDILSLGESCRIFLRPISGTQFLTYMNIELLQPFDTISNIMQNRSILTPLRGFGEVLPPKVIQADMYGVTELPEVTVRRSLPSRFEDQYFNRLNRISLAWYDPYDESTVVPSDPTTIIPAILFTEKELIDAYSLVSVPSYHAAKEFYMPDYDDPDIEPVLNDYRTTLLWEPNISTCEYGEAILELFASDINSTFVVRVEGLSNEGILGFGKSEFLVRRSLFAPDR